MRRPNALSLIVACALFMEHMDSTIIATSLPVIARSLGEDPIALKLALTSYLVSLAVFIPLTGWMTDRFGSRRIFKTAIGVFLLGSVLCGFVTSLGGFVMARFIQGMGGAMMVPVGRIVLMKSVDKKDLVAALAWLTLPALFGPLLGPAVGGLITTYFDWRFIFFINVPIGLAGIALASRYVPQLKEPPRPFDMLGFAVLAVGVSALVLGLATAGQHLLAWHASLVCIAVGVVFIALYAWHAHRVEHPVLDFHYLRIPTYRIGVLGGALFRIGVGATPFLLPLMLQIGFGMTPLQSGLITCISALAAIFMKTISTRVLRRFGFRRVLMVNGVCASFTVALYGVLTPATSTALMLGVLFFGGFFRSMQFTAVNAIAFADIERRDMGAASSLGNVIQQLSLGTGVTVGAYTLQFAHRMLGHEALHPEDFAVAFVIVGLISASAWFMLARLERDAGHELSGAST
ncbi:MAG TPA: MFS transporter [Burkholderiaceae bacterium]|nr:MFS transporter [Burkholderiaceae bacterium]